ncbi:conserved hypothetical protein [Candidatus Nitrosotenuis uzonensis]|uniref:Uncharacterized protein n=1 Tax=Candidatus Nitrosotenuis uzonensis TaxID=1407055 RepID=A0A812F345_9ARCH|nr:conserved hypothetical protein [Candidatus Nitrosotenuis uzonensis]
MRGISMGERTERDDEISRAPEESIIVPLGTLLWKNL